MKILALAMFLASPALAQEPSYGLDFQVGNDVDLNQGFYVCSTDNPRDLMVTLMGIKDANKRRARAASAGCPFRLSNNTGPTYKVTYVAGDACMDRKTVDGSIICGEEGHQILVQHNGRDTVVIQLSLDVSFD